MGRYIRGQVDEEIALGTLASKTLVSQIFDETVNERTLVTSLIATHTMSSFTPADNIGPIMVGVAHSDYSDAEIEEFIENTGSWNEGDKVSQEVGKRLIRQIGVFDSKASGGTLDVVLNDGKPIKTKLKWILLQGQSLRQWCYNLGGSPVATTVPDVHMQGHVNLFPK